MPFLSSDFKVSKIEERTQSIPSSVSIQQKNVPIHPLWFDGETEIDTSVKSKND